MMQTWHSKSVLGIVILVAGALAPAAWPQAAAGKIAFESWQATGTAAASRSQIGVMNADGTQQTNVSNNPFSDYNPSFNRSGSKIVFASDRTVSSHSSAHEIYTMNSDGSNQTRITNNAAAHPPLAIIGPQFSPDGTKIVFAAIPVGIPAAWEVYVINSDGTHQTQLTSNPVGQAGDMAPTFTPDGTKIMFERSHAIGGGSDPYFVDLCEMNPDGSGQTVLTTLEGDFSPPAISPDGRRIALGQRSGSTNTIAIMNADGTGLTVLLSGEFYGSPAFSPDGSKIAFHSVPNILDPNGVDQVYTMNADGSNIAQLTFGSAISPPSSIESNAVPSWAPGSVGLPTLGSVTLNPTSVFPGTTSQGTVSLSQPAPAGGSVVSLSSSSAASVPPSVVIPEGSTSATFAVATLAGTGATTSVVTATYDGVSQTAALAFSPPDTVAIAKLEYTISQKQLRLEATSSSPSATIKAFVTASGALIGTLTNSGGGKYQLQTTWPTSPVNVTITSSLGGSATHAVTVHN